MDELNDLMPISPDHNRERLDTLKQLFPDLFTNEGKLNPEELKKLVSGELVSESERYEFRWQGKSSSKRTAFTPSRAALVYDPVRSVNPDKAGGNMIIEGENLETLKLLTSAYRERIKCIYIDPPYNTGKDFVYADNFAKDKKAYWEETGATEEGVKVDTNSDASGRYHSDWLSMMHSRLLVARQLLRDDGVIFVSIDDNEVHNLRRLMDEVFGEEELIGEFIWKSRQNKDNRTINGASIDHEYVLCYGKTIRGAERNLSQYANLDNDERGLWTSGNMVGLATKDRRPNLHYDLVDPETKNNYGCPDLGWRYDKTTMERLISEKRILWPADPAGRPRRKSFLDELTSDFTGFSSIVGKNCYTRNGTADVEALFGFRAMDFPKPVALIRELLKQGSEENDIILDFFAGSGTTGQAVLDLNRSDGGNRKFILVQLPELADTRSEACKAGLKKISDITIERVKRVINGREGELPFDEAGFKVYKLTKSSFPRVEFAPDPDKTPAENVELLKAYILEKETAFHIAFEKEKIFDEVLLKNGFMLDYTLAQQEQFTANTVYLVKDTYREALLCLDVPIDMATVDYFKEHKDQRFICLEQALDTTRKWNLKHHLGDKFVAF